jgi:hypothetical protein
MIVRFRTNEQSSCAAQNVGTTVYKVFSSRYRHSAVQRSKQGQPRHERTINGLLTLVRGVRCALFSE